MFCCYVCYVLGDVSICDCILVYSTLCILCLSLVYGYSVVFVLRTLTCIFIYIHSIDKLNVTCMHYTFESHVARAFGSSHSVFAWPGPG